MTCDEQSTQTDQYLPVSSQKLDVKLTDILKFIASLLLPLVLGVFTVVLNFQQQETARQQRELERYLSDVLRNTSELQREQDRLAAEKLRELDHNTTKLQRLEDQIAAAMLRELERNLSEGRYQNELMDDYIKNVAQLLKENNGSLASNEVIATISRVSTLNIFRQLGPTRNMRIIRFLYEAKQLIKRWTNPVLDLSTAELYQIDFSDVAGNEERLRDFVLTGVFLQNSTFRNLLMEHVNFTRSKFYNVDVSRSYMKRADFGDTLWDYCIFDLSLLETVNLTLAMIYNVTFARARFKDTDFSYSELYNVSYYSAVFENVNFSFAHLSAINLSDAELINTNFTLSVLRNIDFSYTYIKVLHAHSSIFINCLLLSGMVRNVLALNTQFRNFRISFTRFRETSFTNSLFVNTTLMSVNVANVNFSTSQFDKVIFSSAVLERTTFIASELHNTIFSSIEFSDVHFILTLLNSTKFVDVTMSRTNFQKSTAISVDFNSAIFSDACFIDANMKHVSFIESDLTYVNFARANLYKANFTNSKLTENQLRSALSIQDAILPNGTIAEDKNFLINGQADCNTSVGTGGSWVIHTGNVTTKIWDRDNAQDCYFALTTRITGATMSQRVDLSKKWNTKSWPYSYAVLRANMSFGVSIELRGINGTKAIQNHQTLDSTGRNVSLLLDYNMRDLEIFIKFNAVSGLDSTADYWCDNIKLFIMYGTYLEILRDIPLIPFDGTRSQWSLEDAAFAVGHGHDNTLSQLVDPHGLFIKDDQYIIVADFGNHRIVQWKTSNSSGKVIAGGNGQGSRLDQLNHPTDVLVDKLTDSLIICDRDNRRVVRWSLRNDPKQGEILISKVACWGLSMDDEKYLYVSDTDNQEVRRYPLHYPEEEATLVAGGNGNSTGLNQLNHPSYIFVDRQQTVYVSDNKNHRIMKWLKNATEGIIFASGSGGEYTTEPLKNPNGLVIDRSGTAYIADTSNNRVIGWEKDSKYPMIIAGRMWERFKESQPFSPMGISFDSRGNLFVTDVTYNRVVRLSQNNYI